MRQWTLKAKLRLALALMWLGLIGVGVWSAMETRATMLDERKTGLQNLVDAAEGIAKLYHAKAQSGAMGEDEARKTALATLASLRYGTTGYLFVVDSQLILQMHPTLADMVGKSTAQFKDPTGKPLYPAIVNAPRTKATALPNTRAACRAATPPCPRSATSSASPRGTGTFPAPCSCRKWRRPTSAR